MSLQFSKFLQLIGYTGGTQATMYRDVSENVAKALPYQHSHSTRRFPGDMVDGKAPKGVVMANDGYYFAKERSLSRQQINGGALAYPVDGDRIIMCEWPTMARFHSMRFWRTIAFAGTQFSAAGDVLPGTGYAAEADYWDNILHYFDAGATAAFPPFTVWAEDPNDPNFTPLLLLNEAATTGANRSGEVFPQSAIAYGVNRRDYPLLIVARMEGNVVANSAMALFFEFIVPHS